MDTAKFSRALLMYRNTKDKDTGVSPAEFLLGRQLRDFLPVSKEKILGQKWNDLAKQREEALADRGARLKERWSQNVKALPKLQCGDKVIIQNQLGNRPRQWHKTGVVYRFKGYDQYEVMIDGSRRITLRNRKFLRKIDRPFVKHYPVPEASAPNNHEDDDDEVEFFTPNQSPVLSRANSHENLAQDQLPMENVQEQQQVEIAQEQPPVNQPRRSARANKGQTNRYQDYELHHYEATATTMPIILIDKDWGDITDTNNDADVVVGNDQLKEKERELKGAAGAVWRPWT